MNIYIYIYIYISVALVLSDSWLTCCSFLFPFPLFSFSPSIITIYISSCFSPICGTLLLICFVHAIRFLCFSPCLSFLPSILFFFISVTSFHFLPLLCFSCLHTSLVPSFSSCFPATLSLFSFPPRSFLPTSLLILPFSLPWFYFCCVFFQSFFPWNAFLLQ